MGFQAGRALVRRWIRASLARIYVTADPSDSSRPARRAASHGDKSIMVVRTSRWPSSSCTMRMSYPSSTRCDPKLWRMVRPTRFVTLASRARAASAAAFCTTDHTSETVTAARIVPRTDPSRRKHELPEPLGRRVGEFAIQRERQDDAPEPARQVPLMKPPRQPGAGSTPLSPPSAASLPDPLTERLARGEPSDDIRRPSEAA
jgi:hypothetical protein